MSDFKEISSFKFPEYLKDQKGYGLKLTRALIEGQKSIKELYQSSLGGGNQSGWYEHRFIFIQLFFNKGYFFKVKGHDGLIDSSIFDLLDININNMIEHPGDSQEKQAVKTSKVVVNSFLKGEEVLERNYSLAKSR